MLPRHAAALTRLDHHGEEFTYTPAGGSPITVRGTVNRLDIEPAVPGATRTGRLLSTVFLPRVAGLGVLQVTPGDTVTVAMRLGEAAVVARVVRVVSQDEGAFLFEVKA